MGYWSPGPYVESVRGGLTKLLDADYVDSGVDCWITAGCSGAGRTASDQDQTGTLPFLESDRTDASALASRCRAWGWGSRTTWPGQAAAGDDESMTAYATEVLRSANPVLRTSTLRPVLARRRAIASIARTWPGPRGGIAPEAALQLRTSS